MSEPNLSTPTISIDSNSNDITKYYTFHERIGEQGQFGYAVVATRKHDNQQYAIKIVNKNKFTSVKQRRAHFNELQTEINILKSIHHRHIIKFYETYETNDILYIVTELCSGGELFDEIKRLGSYNELNASKILQQCISGLSYLHKHNIAHCDLKPDNFLFNNNSNDRLIKIIDFGMSKYLDGDRRLHSLRGTPYYIAPEVILGMYSIACCVYSASGFG